MRASNNPEYDTTRNELYPIYDEQPSAEDDIVCMSGRKTRTQCGRVTDPSATITYNNPPNEVTVADRVITDANLCPAGTDSGGSVYVLNSAYGIISGHINNQAGNCIKGIYAKIAKAENYMNVDVIHS